MFDVWSIVQWWDEWQLRILALGSLCIQWFLLLAAPMRKYTIHCCFRGVIWLAYVSSDALAIYALATLFNRHAKVATSVGCGAAAVSKGSILEVLWAPILLIHLGGQEELTAYTIEDNELWIRHTVTLVSQVSIAVYAFYKSWPSASDWRLLASAILLFIIGVISFIEKPWALWKASINRLADVSAVIQGTEKRSTWDLRLNEFFFFDEYNCFSTKSGSDKNKQRQQQQKGGALLPIRNCFIGKEEGRDNKQLPKGKEATVKLSDGDKVYMILSDMSLSAAADELVLRKKAESKEEVLPPLTSELSDTGMRRWLRGAFVFIYTRANVVLTYQYLVYHLLVVPALHIAALTLFATTDKHPYNYTDVKTTYVLLSFTAALDVLAVFIRQLVYLAMSLARVPALCETVPGYNLIDAVLRRRHKNIGCLVRCAARMGCKEDCSCVCEGGDNNYKLYKKVSGLVLPDLVKAQGRDLASYRIFTEQEPAAPSPSEQQPPPRSQHAEAACGPDTETQTMIGPGAGSSFITEHNRPATPSDNKDRQAAPSDDEQQLVEQQHDDVEASDDGIEIKHAEAAGTKILARTGMSSSPPQLSSSHKSSSRNWALREELQKVCGPEIRRSLRGSFDRGVLLWHIATDICFRMQCDRQPADPRTSCGRGWWCTGTPSDTEDDNKLRMECTDAISNYMAHLLNSHPDMLMTGSRQHLVKEAMDEIESILEAANHSSQRPNQVDLDNMIKMEARPGSSKFHISQACMLAKELRDLPGEETRWDVMYHVWLGMLCYSASMCRGYLHAKSLGEGGEFLSYVWLVLSLKGAKTLADKLQMVDTDEEKTPVEATSSSAPKIKKFDMKQKRFILV